MILAEYEMGCYNITEQGTGRLRIFKMEGYKSVLQYELAIIISFYKGRKLRKANQDISATATGRCQIFHWHIEHRGVARIIH